MPRDYNIPSWYDSDYDKKTEEVLALIETAFRTALTWEDLAMISETCGYCVASDLASHAGLDWDSPASNIGTRALFECPPQVFRLLFPSIARAAIEMLPRTRSAADDEYLVDELTSSLAVEGAGLERVRSIADNLTHSETEALVAWLVFVATRDNECGWKAKRAIAMFWAARLYELRGG
jgi:hypothetical protein